jgi:hypothetical protein
MGQDGERDHVLGVRDLRQPSSAQPSKLGLDLQKAFTFIDLGGYTDRTPSEPCPRHYTGDTDLPCTCEGE